MATAKKTTTKKAPVTKKASVAKKTPVKRAAVTKKASTSTAAPKMRSFRVAPNNPAFGTFKITRQTVYWIIIVSVIIFMQLWILSMQIDTSMYIENELSTIEESV